MSLHFYVLGTVLLTAHGQCVIKWQMSKVGPLPDGVITKLHVLFGVLLNPWIYSALTAAIVAAFCWMAAMTMSDLSYAYPFVGLSFVLVLALSSLLLGEAVALPKAIGMILIVAGIVVASRV